MNGNQDIFIIQNQVKQKTWHELRNARKISSPFTIAHFLVIRH
jgi:hypothetical protein